MHSHGHHRLPSADLSPPAFPWLWCHSSASGLTEDFSSYPGLWATTHSLSTEEAGLDSLQIQLSWLACLGICFLFQGRTEQCFARCELAQLHRNLPLSCAVRDPVTKQTSSKDTSRFLPRARADRHLHFDFGPKVPTLSTFLLAGWAPLTFFLHSQSFSHSLDSLW